MIQLWVNLPAAYKNAPPGYQTLPSTAIPSVPLPDQAGHVRVIAGGFAGQHGPARTFTPIELWDVRLAGGRTASLTPPEGHTATIVVLKGEVLINAEAALDEAAFAVLGRTGSIFTRGGSGRSRLDRQPAVGAEDHVDRDAAACCC